MVKARLRTMQVFELSVSELRTLPPYTEPNCPDHATSFIQAKGDTPQINDNTKKSKSSKRKKKMKKNASDDFVFSSKAARRSTPHTSSSFLVENIFENQEQYAENSLDPEPKDEIPKQKSTSWLKLTTLLTTFKILATLLTQL
ncbi:hypothetical protein TNCV_749991 [Trichonephila clavipes]|nr:hypothetical protein TNCV_749991 [Trichonephila clavipes]